MNLGRGVRVGSLDEERYGFGFSNFLDEGVFFFAEGLFVYEARPAEDIGREVIDGVLGRASTDEL